MELSKKNFTAFEEFRTQAFKSLREHVLRMVAAYPGFDSRGDTPEILQSRRVMKALQAEIDFNWKLFSARQPEEDLEKKEILDLLESALDTKKPGEG